jgi:choline dehydrogenase
MNERANSLMGRLAMGLEYALFRRGPLTMAPSQLGAFAKSDAARETPDLEYHVQPLSLDKFGDPLHPFPAFTASVCNLRPESRGSVRIRSPDPVASPAIKPNYLATARDRKVAAEAIRLTRRICAAPALSRFRPEEFKPGPQLKSDDELARRPATSAPPSSTRWERPRWAGTTWRWWTSACGFTALRACGWSTPRSCRPSPPATPTRPP